MSVVVTFTIATTPRTGGRPVLKTGTRVLPSAWAAREWVAARTRFSTFTHVSTLPEGA